MGWKGSGKSFVVKNIFKCFLILRVIHVRYKLEGKKSKVPSFFQPETIILKVLVHFLVSLSLMYYMYSIFYMVEMIFIVNTFIPIFFSFSYY